MAAVEQAAARVPDLPRPEGTAELAAVARYINELFSYLRQEHDLRASELPATGRDVSEAALTSALRAALEVVERVSADRQKLGKKLEKLQVQLESRPLLQPLARCVPHPDKGHRAAVAHAREVCSEIRAQYPLRMTERIPALPWDPTPARAVKCLNRLVGFVESLPDTAPRPIQIAAGPAENKAATRTDAAANSVQVEKSVGVLVGDNGVLSVHHECSVPHPVVEIADLIAVGAGASTWHVRADRSGQPGEHVGFHAGLDPTAAVHVYNSAGVVTADNAKLNLTVRHELKCQISPFLLLADPTVRELVEELGGAADAEVGPDERASAVAKARHDLPVAVARVLAEINPELVIRDYTDQLADAARRPVVSARRGQVRIVHANGVAIGDNTVKTDTSAGALGRAEFKQ